MIVALDLELHQPSRRVVQIGGVRGFRGTRGIQLRAEGGMVRVTQAEIAELFQTTPQNITLHIKAIYAERELLAEATCKEHLQVREEGKRKVKRALKHYNLDVVPVVGYRYRRGLRSATSASISASEFHRSPCWLRS